MAKIMMPIDALNEDCVKCKDLDIVIDSDLLALGDDDYILQRSIGCRNYHRCQKAYDSGIKYGRKEMLKEIAENKDPEP